MLPVILDHLLLQARLADRTAQLDRLLLRRLVGGNTLALARFLSTLGVRINLLFLRTGTIFFCTLYFLLILAEHRRLQDVLIIHDALKLLQERLLFGRFLHLLRIYDVLVNPVAQFLLAHFLKVC